MYPNISYACSRYLFLLACLVLLAMAPLSLVAEEKTAVAPEGLNADTVIYPKGGAKGAASSSDSFSGTPLVVLAALLAGAGAWVLFKRRQGDLRFNGASGKKLMVEETKSLGNRQYLVVASYSGRKFLLGVTTDRIELLTHLDDGSPEE